MPDTAQALTRHDVVDHLRATDAAPSSGPLRVGIEQEWHTYALADPKRHLRPEELLQAVEQGAPLPCASRVTVEPGGQIELATDPRAPWTEAVTALRVDGAVLRNETTRESFDRCETTFTSGGAMFAGRGGAIGCATVGPATFGVGGSW